MPSGKEKRHGADFDEPSRAKKVKHGTHQSTTIDASEERRPSRAGAGSGGRIAQLERIGAVIQAPRARKSRTTLPDDLQPNALAPTKPASRQKAKVVQLSGHVLLLIH